MPDTKLLTIIRLSDKKPKELLIYLAGLIKQDKTLLADFAVSLDNAKDAQKGTCVEALEYATQTNPEIAIPHLKSIINSLTDQAPRVKWEAARVIANLAPKYPTQAAQALDNLLLNTKDKGTVVRWSTALALGEILKANAKIRASLQKTIEDLVKKEANNGVKNVYLKALKVVGK